MADARIFEATYLYAPSGPPGLDRATKRDLLRDQAITQASAIRRDSERNEEGDSDGNERSLNSARSIALLITYYELRQFPEAVVGRSSKIEGFGLTAGVINFSRKFAANQKSRKRNLICSQFATRKILFLLHAYCP